MNTHPNRRALLRGFAVGALAQVPALHAQPARRAKLVLPGPFAGVSNPPIRIADSGALRDVADSVEFVTWKDPDHLRVLAIEGGAGDATPHPVWQCGLRPFFIAAALAALIAVAPWLAWLAGWPQALPASAWLPATQWHAAMLLVGMGMAAVAGFLLTAIPEFTSTPGFTPRQIRLGTWLWLLGFVGDGIAQRATLASAAVAWIAFLVWLLGLVWPRAWRQSGGRTWASSGAWPRSASVHSAGTSICCSGAPPAGGWRPHSARTWR